MRLEGYRCDECAVESNDKPGDWHQVQACRVTDGRSGLGFSASFSDGLHYCSKECLIAAAGKWKTR